MSLLITGAFGFIGSNFVEFMRVNHPDDNLVLLDDFSERHSFSNRDRLAGHLKDCKIHLGNFQKF